jgi:hypothetical protein
MKYVRVLQVSLVPTARTVAVQIALLVANILLVQLAAMGIQLARAMSVHATEPSPVQLVLLVPLDHFIHFPPNAPPALKQLLTAAHVTTSILNALPVTRPLC